MKHLKLIIFIGFMIRLIYAIRIGYQGEADGLDMDAESFYLRMVIISRTGMFEDLAVGEAIVLNTIGMLMSLFGDDVFVGCFFSCIAWLVAGLYFATSLNLTDADDKTKMIAVLLFSFWPTAIPYTTITLREPYQLMFASAALYAALSLFRKRNALYWAFLVLCLFGTGATHGGLAAFALMLLLLSAIFYALFVGEKFPVGPIGLALIFAVVIGYFGLTNINAIGYEVDRGVIDTAQAYQTGGLGTIGRTTYKDDVSINGLLDAILFLPVGLFQYLFEPMPWKVSTIPDLVLFAENAVRLLIIVAAMIEFRKSPAHPQRTLLLFLFLAYFAQEAIWSLGTINWGTASRHHVPAMPYLILLAAQTLFLRTHRLSLENWTRSASLAN
jgi:hypothetical protein